MGRTQIKPGQPAFFVANRRKLREPVDDRRADRTGHVRSHLRPHHGRDAHFATSRRSSSVISVMLFGGIALVRPANTPTRRRFRSIISGESRTTPFRPAVPSPGQPGSGAWHIAQRETTTSATSSGARGTPTERGRSAERETEIHPGRRNGARRDQKRSGEADRRDAPRPPQIPAAHMPHVVEMTGSARRRRERGRR